MRILPTVVSAASALLLAACFDLIPAERETARGGSETSTAAPGEVRAVGGEEA